jgi:hypothetical protein
MKKEYNIKDKVWIHLGERKLVEGRVVEIIDLVHLKEGHSPDRELYIIELKTGIDDIYEVRDYDQISPDAKGPINLFRRTKDVSTENQRYLKRVGIQLPIDTAIPLTELLEDDEDGPSTEEIHAALAMADVPQSTIFRPTPAKRPAKKRTFSKQKKTV